MPTKKMRDRQTQRALNVAPQINLSADAAKALDAYLTEHIDAAIKKRDEILPRVEKWRKTISGTRPTPGARRSTSSNISVPLTIWARVAVRARITESILETFPIASVEAYPARREGSDKSTNTIANSLAKFISSQILNSRGLQGKQTIEKIASEVTDIGGSAMKVIPTMGTVKKVGPGAGARANARPQKVPIPGHVQWKHIPFLDLIYVDGYGTNTQKMPFIGHQFRQIYSEMVLFGNLGHYDATAVEAVKAQGNEDDKLHLPKEHSIAEHDLAEIYLDWDVDNDDIREAILITWHIKSKKRLRTVWNPFPDGRRPILIGQFDHPADITQVRGQGVSEKLEGAQDEADAIHNIGIEAGKRGVAHVIVLKEGTRAEEEFGGEDDLLPGDVIITSTPDEDVKSVALGDPKAGLAAIELEEHTRVYVTRILGLDESRMGNVESGKRVTKAVGMATMREGRMIIKAALSSLSHMLSEAAYLTIDLYKRFTPMEAIYSVLDREEAEALIESVFSLSDVSSRSSFLVRINAQDAALIQENKQQEMMILSQALFPFYDRQANLIMQLASPELPPAAKKPLLMLIERMERGMEALLNTVDSVPNPEELLVKINELTKLLEATEGPPAIPEEPVQEGDSPSLVGDLGAGVT